VDQAMKNDSGFTLVELMVALSLLGLIISGGFAIYYFAHKSFVDATVVAEIQGDMQLAMMQITNSLRTAYKASFLDTKTSPLPSLDELGDEEIILLVYEGRPTMYKKPAPVILASQHVDYAQYEFVFKRVHSGGILLEDVVEIELKAKDYELVTSAKLLNLREGAIEGNPGTNGANAFRYQAVYVPDDIGDIEAPDYRCFIATAVYGLDSAMTNILRLFRDRVLLATNLGRAIVRLYYTYSPHAAAVLDHSLLLRLLVGIALLPLVLMAYALVYPHWAAAFAMITMLYILRYKH
jgi:prepilin-type N-terminal cleavage/methylation domain-containing protein